MLASTDRSHMAIAWKERSAAGADTLAEKKWKSGGDDNAADADSLWYERLLRRRSSDAAKPDKLGGPAMGLRKQLSEAHATYQQAHQAARLARRSLDVLAKSTGRAMGEEYIRERETMERLRKRMKSTS